MCLPFVYWLEDFDIELRSFCLQNEHNALLCASYFATFDARLSSDSPHLHQIRTQKRIQEIVPVLRFYCFLGAFLHF